MFLFIVLAGPTPEVCLVLVLLINNNILISGKPGCGLVVWGRERGLHFFNAGDWVVTVFYLFVVLFIVYVTFVYTVCTFSDIN